MGVIYTLGATAGSDTSAVTATAADVLNPKVIVDKNGNPLTGTMTNNGAFNRTTSYGGSVTIPAGYHNGQGKITGGSFAFSGTAGQGDVLKGQTFYANNSTKLTGTMANNGAFNRTTSYGGSVTIPAGYHNGSGKITGGTFSFSGNAGTADVATGKTFYSTDGTKRTGIIDNKRSQWVDIKNFRTATKGGDFEASFDGTGYGVIIDDYSYIGFNMRHELYNAFGASYDATGSARNRIRSGPGTAYNEDTFFYTGRRDGNWREVIIYGWQNVPG